VQLSLPAATPAVSGDNGSTIAVDVAHVANEWLKCMSSNSSYESYRKARWVVTDVLLPQIGTRPIGDLSSDFLRRVLTTHNQSNKPEKARRTRQSLAQIIRFAAAAGWVPFEDAEKMIRSTKRART